MKIMIVKEKFKGNFLKTKKERKRANKVFKILCSTINPNN